MSNNRMAAFFVGAAIGYAVHLAFWEVVDAYEHFARSFGCVVDRVEKIDGGIRVYQVFQRPCRSETFWIDP